MRRDAISRFQGRSVLLLQGPLGPFFARLAADLRAVGATVKQVCFNGGDLLFSDPSRVLFKGDLKDWPDAFGAILDSGSFDAVILFGDNRPAHRMAHRIAKDRGLEVDVFEEGYIRPDYVTFESDGVNGHSLTPRDPLFYRALPEQVVPGTAPIGNTFWPAAFWAITYYTAAILLSPMFPHYRHHRPLNAAEAFRWVRGAFRKQIYAWRERGVQDRLTSFHAGRFFLLPLQVHNDAQIHVHSEFSSVDAFLEVVVESFARCAPPDTLLVVKHHPMDRPYRDYSAALARLRDQHHLTDRLLYIHDQHLPSLLQNARGVVLINSTVGLSALHHGTPLKVCGDAIYDLPGLTVQGSLNKFWRAAAKHRLDVELHQRFVGHLIRTTQINGSFYRRTPGASTRTGLVFEQADLQARPDPLK